MDEHVKRTTYTAVIGAVLAEERNLRGISQLVAASCAKPPLAQSTWARLELGKACNADNLARAAGAFEIEPWQLIKVADDRVKALRSQGIEVLFEAPSEEELKTEPEAWLSADAISRLSTIGLGTGLAIAAVAGIGAYINKVFNSK